MLGLVIVSVIVMLVASGSDDPDSGSSTAVDVVKLVLGALFLVMAFGQWHKRPSSGQVAELPKWMSAIDQFKPGKSFVLGAALSGANPKNLALTLAAVASVAQAGLDGSESAIAIGVFIIIGSLTVAGPVLFFVVAADSARGPLESTKQFLSEHNAAIMTAVLLVLGAKLLGNGIAGLAE